jgi:hypothetical protein
VCKGPLWRALEDGYLFFADEFNLAEPAVLNMLMVRRLIGVAAGAMGALYPVPTRKPPASPLPTPTVP